MLDADRRDIGHHGQKTQILFRELARNVGHIDIQQPDHLFVGLQRDSHEATNPLHHDARLQLEHLIHGSVADQQRILVAQHLIAYGFRDAEAFAPIGSRHQIIAFEGHQYASRTTNCIHRQVQNQLKQFAQRAVSRQFPARTNESGCVAFVRHRLHGIEVFQAGDDGVARCRFDIRMFDEHHCLAQCFRVVLSGKSDLQVTRIDDIALA